MVAPRSTDVAYKIDIIHLNTDLKKLDLNYQPPADNTSSASVSFLFSTHTRPRVSSKYQAQPGKSPHYLVELFTLGGGASTKSFVPDELPLDHASCGNRPVKTGQVGTRTPSLRVDFRSTSLDSRVQYKQGLMKGAIQSFIRAQTWVLLEILSALE
ncbi:hypothetical protein J6590_106140 [Homalodisca vitripennis]|nr:hypothetical protein J6590_106140 [Homalodisca vitripennis]